MNMHSPQAPLPERERKGWDVPTHTPEGLAGEALEDWRATVTAVCAFATENGLSRAAVADRSGVSAGTLYPWVEGAYRGNYASVTARFKAWLLAEEDRRRAALTKVAEPGYVETKTAKEVAAALLYAQTLPGMVLVTLGPGMGKTTVARRIEETRPHAYRIVMRPSTGTVFAMLRELAARLSIEAGSPSDLGARIGERLKRNGRQTLLMVDEAQNCNDDTINELRFFLDEYGCGIALLGNEDVHHRWGKTEPKEGYGQVHRRIAMRLRRLKPTREDIDTFVSAWNIDDEEIRQLLRVIGGKPGSLGQITETLKLAAIMAAPHNRAISADDVRRAWTNRAGEELR
jgi:hypothetical protein